MPAGIPVLRIPPKAPLRIEFLEEDIVAKMQSHGLDLVVFRAHHDTFICEKQFLRSVDGSEKVDREEIEPPPNIKDG